MASRHGEFDARYREMVINVVAAIGQVLLALVAGGVAGYLAEPAVTTALIGAVALCIGTLASYAVANLSLLFLAPIALAKKPPEEPPPEDDNDHSGFVWWAGVTVVMVSIFVAATITAIIVAAVSDIAPIDTTLGYFLLASLPVALLTIRARRVAA